MPKITHSESPQAIAMRLTAEYGRERAIRLCEHLAASCCPLTMRTAYQSAAMILTGSTRVCPVCRTGHARPHCDEVAS